MAVMIHVGGPIAIVVVILSFAQTILVIGIVPRRADGAARGGAGDWGLRPDGARRAAGARA